MVPVLAALALVAGGYAFANRGDSGAASSAGPSTAVTSTTGPASASPSPQASSSSEPSNQPSATSGDDDEADRALSGCRKKVRAGDKVIKAADRGVGDWAIHVQAQTDANRAKITVAAMDGKFAKTRLAGPADQKRYADALSDYSQADGSCDAVTGASKKIAMALTKCSQRSKAQRPVIRAAAPAMKDWKSHLAAMQRSREGHVVNAQGIWLKAWRAAPPHIKAYQKAAADFDAPSC